MTTYKSINLSSIVRIDDWHTLDYALEGSRDKRTVADPETDDLFVFKEPKEYREAQIWSELIASFVAGDLLGWPVQHTQIAIRDGMVGNLLRYIYNPRADNFTLGERFCKHVDPLFDPQQGKRHTWELIKKIHDEIVGYNQDGSFRKYVSAEYFQFWARTIAFDTLISNTDRHAENWAFTLSEEMADLMAPMYDNASSLGCEVELKGLAKWFKSNGEINASKVDSYVEKGRHHLRDGGERFHFEVLARKFLSEFPEHRTEFEAISNIDLILVEQVLDDITNLEGVPESAKMTTQRRIQITRLLQEGQARVMRVLEETHDFGPDTY